MKANSWLYHYYMVQSRLQYSLAYGGQSPTSLAAFYPGMQANAAGFTGQNPFDGHMLHASAFMASPQSSHYSGYAGYTPPPGAYNLHQHYQQHHQQQQQQQQQQHHGSEQRSGESPLDFSAAANQYGNSWGEEMRNFEENGSGSKIVGFNDVTPSNGDRTSSPEYRYLI
jgi:hypothetical protein